MKARLPGYTWINAVLFQAAWLTCVLGSVQSALIASALFLTFHLAVVENRKEELAFIIPVAAAGFMIDSVIDLAGILNISPSGVFPVYLICLWLLFAATLRWSMRFFFYSQLSAAVLGMLAPVSYCAAQTFEKVKYTEPMIQSIAVHALLWTVLMLIVQYIVNKNEVCRLNAG